MTYQLRITEDFKSLQSRAQYLSELLLSEVAGVDYQDSEAFQYRLWVIQETHGMTQYGLPKNCSFAQPAIEKDIRGNHHECGYLIFSDGSLYVRSSSDDEVWADARDFCEKIFLNEHASSIEFEEADFALAEAAGFEVPAEIQRAA